MEYVLTGFLSIIVAGCVLGFLFFILKLLAFEGLLGKKMSFCFAHNYKYSKQYDNAVNYALNYCRIVKVTDYEIIFENGLKVWINNKWYGYGHSLGMDGRVSWNTAKKLIQIERSRRGK